MNDYFHELPLAIIAHNIMLYGCHKVMTGEEWRVRDRSETNRLLKVMVTLESGGHGVIIILRMCPRR